jgi:HEAT repeats
MQHPLPLRPNLEQFKRQAKDLLKDYRAGDPVTGRLVEQYWSPHFSSGPDSKLGLAEAQHIVARAYGFASWPKLKQHVETVLAAQHTLSVRPATPDKREARRRARQQQTQALAERLIAAAQKPDLGQVFQALMLPAHDLVMVRAYLVDQQAYAGLIDALLRGVDDPHARTRFLTAQAMDHFADPRCAEPLRRLLHDPVPRVRWAALHSLTCEACKLEPLPATDDLVVSLIDLAQHDVSIKVRRVATYELGNVCHDERARASLATILAQEPDRTIRRHAQAALDRQRQND